MSMSFSSAAAAVPTFTLRREDPWALPFRGHLQVVREAAPQRYGVEVEEDREIEDDVLEALGDEIACLAAHIHAATHRMLQLIAEFDERRGWERDGHRSCAHWLAFRTGVDLGAAREKVRAARALNGLPRTSASMARGELSFSQVRALTRVATEENEADLLELARGCTTAQLERVIRSWRRGSRKDEAARERERHESRSFAVFPDDDGMYVVKGRLEPEVAAVLMKAIEAANQALRRQEPDGPAARIASDEETRRAATQRRADAIGLLAERALAAGFGGACDGEEDDAPISGIRAERFQVVLHVDPETLSAGGENEAAEEEDPAPARGRVGARPGPRSHLDDGTRVSAETSRRLACDCALVPVVRGADGSVLDIGRRTRTIPPALRRALEVRDKGCRFPGCGLRFSDAHHLEHWADGGETSLANTLLLCRHHHRLVHEGGWRVMWWGVGRPVFVDPRGGEHFDGGWRAPVGVEVDEMIDANVARGVHPDWRTASARWKRVEDVPADQYWRAMEAVG